MSKSKLETQFKEQLRYVDVTNYQEQYKFHPVRKWRFDFAFPEKKVAVELHGATWSGGRHTRGSGFQKDREKMNEAILLGWQVLEVTKDQLDSGNGLFWLTRLLDLRIDKDICETIGVLTGPVKKRKRKA